MPTFLSQHLFRSQDQSGKHRLIADVEAKGAGTDQGAARDEGTEHLHEPFTLIRRGKWHPESWPWKYLLQAGLTLAGMWLTWTLATPPPTRLHDEILTADGKSFPSGQLTWSQRFTPLPCGRSPTEAWARGCHFDIIATAWLLPNCIDDELAVEFAALHPWQYFSRPDGTAPFSANDPDTLGAQTGLIWTTDRWHAAHCLYMWKKLNRAIVRGWMTDAETVMQAHTDHCTMNIMNMGDPDAIRGIMEVIYPPC